MAFAKSKLISSSPDYFITSLAHSAGRLREPATAVAINAGNYGYLTVYNVQHVNMTNTLVAFTLNIIIDALLFE